MINKNSTLSYFHGVFLATGTCVFTSIPIQGDLGEIILALLVFPLFN